MNAPHPPEPAAFDPRILRRALGNFATGVIVATASDGEDRVGVTANSFSSVSLDPPLILWSIDKRSGSLPVFRRASHFAVNILAMDQIELSNRFARPHEDRYAGVPWRPGLGGCVLLDGASANFQCERTGILEGGDHWILVGRVLAFEDKGTAPLLYHQGSYAMALPHPHRRPPQDASGGDAANDLRARLADHPYFLMTQAVRSYQESYQPRQIQTGWRPGEARLLMILNDGPARDMTALTRQADMPQHQVEQTLDLLRSRGLVERTPDGEALTADGATQVCGIWAMARSHEERVFARFERAQVETFKQVLRGIIAAPA
jgi:flavin reductase (DIM6/NTAB) family NADH-FMN oxidoreductase RutF/DNA-binding MarR family transcriptional regulator